MLNNLYQSLDPVAFTIGPFSARWYGLAYVVGFIWLASVGRCASTSTRFASLCYVP